MELLENLFLATIPLFVAMDALGILPLFISITDGITPSRKNQFVTEATLAAFVIALIFLVSGKLIFQFLGITENDFRIAGGIVLLVLAITDLLFSQDRQRRKPEEEPSLSIVPISIPLIIGPAAMTTILILVDQFGYFLTLISLTLNLAFVWIVFRNSHWVIRILGISGSRAFAKVASLFIAAIAVMMIRLGITGIMESISG